MRVRRESVHRVNTRVKTSRIATAQPKHPRDCLMGLAFYGVGVGVASAPVRVHDSCAAPREWRGVERERPGRSDIRCSE